MKRRAITLRVGTWNTHTGIALENGGLRWLRRHAPWVRLWCLQEVHDRNVAAIREQMGSEWMIFPPRSHGREGGLPYLLAHRGTFKREWFTVEDVKESQHARAMVHAGLVHRPTGRLVVASSVHVDPLGKGFVDSDPNARWHHEQQVQAYADAVGKRPTSTVVLDGGDWNERLGAEIPRDLREKTAIGRMGRVGSEPASQLVSGGLVLLDDFFVRKASHVKVTKRRTLVPAVDGGDHAAVVVTMKLKHLLP